MKNKSRIINVLLLPVLIVLLCGTLSADNSEVVLDANFFKEFNKQQLIQRDEFIDGLINRIVIGRGTITGIAPNERYKKKYRVIIESSDSAPYNQKFVFYLFLDNKDTINLLSLNSKFEFKGQLMGYTPLVSKRNEYILEVIMMDGSTVIE